MLTEMLQKDDMPLSGVYLSLIACCCFDGLPAGSTPLVHSPVGADMPQTLGVHLQVCIAAM